MGVSLSPFLLQASIYISHPNFMGVAEDVDMRKHYSVLVTHESGITAD